MAYGCCLFTGGLDAHYGAERLGCTVPASGGMTERQVRLIVDFEPDIIMVPPSYMLAILDQFARQDIDAQASSLKVGIFGADGASDRTTTHPNVGTLPPSPLRLCDMEECGFAFPRTDPGST